MKRLIVNADDFGMSEAVDLGIALAHREGIVTSTSLLAGGASAEHAAKLAKENPGLGVGVHLCLTRLSPVGDPSGLNTITRGGHFFDGPLPFMARLASGAADMREVKSELRAQIKRAVELGITPTHLDGHQHMHIMPGVFPIVAELAQEFGIRAVRFPVGPWTGVRGLARALEKLFLEALAKSQEARLKAGGLKRPDFFFGLAQTGRLDAGSLIGIIEALPDGTSELMCHPGLRDDAAAARLGWGEGWHAELGAVTDGLAIKLLSERGVELVGYNSL